MPKSPILYLLVLALFAALFVVAITVHSNNEANRLAQMRIDTNLAIRQYCIDRKMAIPNCQLWADDQTDKLSQAGVQWASSCTKDNPPDQQVLFCLNYAKDLK